jgi:hypothetical protein
MQRMNGGDAGRIDPPAGGGLSKAKLAQLSDGGGAVFEVLGHRSHPVDGPNSCTQYNFTQEEKLRGMQLFEPTQGIAGLSGAGLPANVAAWASSSSG